ncbi:MAG: hypothetical protein R3C69_14920 [Geminicoccaceae bacterium]
MPRAAGRRAGSAVTAPSSSRAASIRRRVCAFSRRPEDRVDRAVLDHPAALHHRDPVRHLGDHAHVA